MFVLYLLAAERQGRADWKVMANKWFHKYQEYNILYLTSVHVYQQLSKPIQLSYFFNDLKTIGWLLTFVHHCSLSIHTINPWPALDMIRKSLSAVHKLHVTLPTTKTNLTDWDVTFSLKMSMKTLNFENKIWPTFDGWINLLAAVLKSAMFASFLQNSTRITLSTGGLQVCRK